MFDQIILSQQLKRSLIVSNKHGIYKLPHELLNSLTLKSLNFKELYSVFLPQQKLCQCYQNILENIN